MKNKNINTEKNFINFTNHPSNKWDVNQVNEAKKFGKIIDLPFPSVDAKLTENDIEKLASEAIKPILQLNPTVVLCQGEFSLTFSIIQKLKECKINVVVACSERNVTESVDEEGNTKKTSVFRFVKFRKV